MQSVPLVKSKAGAEQTSGKKGDGVTPRRPRDRPHGSAAFASGFYTSAYRKQSMVWSLTIPTACMKA